MNDEEILAVFNEARTVYERDLVPVVLTISQIIPGPDKRLENPGVIMAG